jgi:hypothetical protein
MQGDPETSDPMGQGGEWGFIAFFFFFCIAWGRGCLSDANWSFLERSVSRILTSMICPSLGRLRQKHHRFVSKNQPNKNIPERNQLYRRTDLYWLKVLVHDCLTPISLDLWQDRSPGMRARLLTSWWLGSKEREESRILICPSRVRPPVT